MSCKLHPSISTYMWAINLVLTGPCVLSTIPPIKIYSLWQSSFQLIWPSHITGPVVLAKFSHLSHITIPMADNFWCIQKMVKKAFKNIFMGVGHMQKNSTCLFKDTNWSMRDIIEVQMLRYSEIMLRNCCNVQSSLLSSIMNCHQWVMRSLN